jgi:trehalose 6-phosphate synthase
MPTLSDPSVSHAPPAPSRARAARPPLVVVSNRLALPGSTQTGGLATGLRRALDENGGVWVGWSGKVSSGGTASVHAKGVSYRSVDLTEAEHRDFYLGFANRALWPVLHSRLDMMEYERAGYDAYRQVNARFADEVVPLLADDSLLWIHDFHLFPLAGLLRERGVRQRIGFFLHTPFPAPDIARALPGHREVFAGLGKNDLIGVQTPRDAEHLREYLRRHDRDADPARVRVFPIGIDPAEVAADAERPSSLVARRRLRESLAGRRLVIGVDRLDYSKGLPERFKAYGRMLDRHTDLRRNVSYLQIAPVSRGEVAEYRALKARLDGIAGEINGRHGDADWVPLRYVVRSHPHATVSAYLREAGVGLVTPLRDGMNLVAKEYVAAQRAEDPGVLVLSEFAGAAEQMHGGALLVNPFDTCAVADTLALALRMSLRERRARWESLMGDLLDHSLSDWRREFLECLQAPVDTGARAADAPATVPLRPRVVGRR